VVLLSQVLLVGECCIQLQVRQGCVLALLVFQAKQGSSQGGDSKASEPQGRWHQELSEAS